MNGHGYSSPPTTTHPPDAGWNDAAYSNAYNDTQRLNQKSWLANSADSSANNQHTRTLSDDKKNFLTSLGGEPLANLKRKIGRMLLSSGTLPLWSSERRGTLTQPPRAASVIAGAPSTATLRFIFLCSCWYMSSAMSSNTGKTILNQFRYPVTLTLVQFGFVALYSLLFMSPAIQFTKLRRPTRAIFNTTLPMGLFQVGGHMFSSMAISRIPVSTVHTIKALSPLFTVAAYALLFNVSYSPQTYMSLLPLTLGVMLACTFDMSASNFIGLLCAFGSAIIFVTSNIFFKKVMPSNNSQASSHKLDKLNLLFYSSSMAFLLMIPIWLWSDLPTLLYTAPDPSQIYAGHPSTGHTHPHSVTWSFFTNGTVHFAQNIIAFIILSSTSPVTYSIASLIKRVVVICIAIVWFSQKVHPVQGFGIVLTFTGLWMYNRAKGDVEKGEKKVRRVEAARDMRLPTTMSEEKEMADEGKGLRISVPTQPSVTYANPESTSPYAQTRARFSSISAGAPPQVNSYAHPPHLYQQNANYKHLHLKLHPHHAIPSNKTVASPTDSYPSPPPSLDSPPSSPPLGYGQQPQQQPIAVQ